MCADCNGLGNRFEIDPDLVADPDIDNHTPGFATSTTDFLDSLTVIGVISYRSGGSVHGYVDSVRFSETATAFADVVGVSPLSNGNGTLFIIK